MEIYSVFFLVYFDKFDLIKEKNILAQYLGHALDALFSDS
jgi:hypothetical protein